VENYPFAFSAVEIYPFAFSEKTGVMEKAQKDNLSLRMANPEELNSRSPLLPPKV
jgi:hypothetical protein